MKEEKARLEKEKQEEKAKRHLAREAKRKQNEQNKLKEEINNTFVVKGESKEHILA